MVALINSASLRVMTVLVAVESIRRLIEHTAEPRGLPMPIVSLATMVVLLIGAWVLGASASTEDLHIRSVLIDTLAARPQGWRLPARSSRPPAAFSGSIP